MIVRVSRPSRCCFSLPSISWWQRPLQEHPEYTVAAVSESTGFASLSYFTKIFREKEGQTPGKWIRSVR